MKFYKGGWTEPGLAASGGKLTEGSYNQTGGRFTPLNLPSQGYMHGDAAYNSVLKQWCIVVMSGGRIQLTKEWRQV